MSGANRGHALATDFDIFHFAVSGPRSIIIAAGYRAPSPAPST